MHYLPDIGWIQTLDPFAIQFTSSFGIRWYGLAYLAGFLAAYLLIRFLIRKKASPLPEHLLGDFIFTIALGTILGGRIGYCVFYSPDLLLQFRANFPFWGVLAIHEGGMASHGGMVGILLACWYFARKHRLSAFHLSDLCALTSGIGIFFGRLANFVNGELLGRKAPLDCSWAVRFPQEILLWPEQAPDNLAALEKVYTISQQGQRDFASLLSFPRSQEMYGFLENTLTALQNGNREVLVTLAPLLTPRYPSQIIAAFCEGLFIFLILFWLYRKPRVNGFLTASCVFLYACLRILSESFRLPDAHIGYQLLGLTRGQWLSIAMLTLGLLMCLYFRKKKQNSSLAGGWLTKNV